MKFNNVETLATALESAVTELTEVKAQLAQARSDRDWYADQSNKVMAELLEADVSSKALTAELRRDLLNAEAHAKEAASELVQVRDELRAAGERANILEVGRDQWRKRAEKAEAKVAAHEKYREQDLDSLVFEYAYHAWRMNTAKNDADKLKEEGACNAISYVIGLLYQISVTDYQDCRNENHMLIEVWGGDKPVAYYHWRYENGTVGKFKVEVK